MRTAAALKRLDPGIFTCAGGRIRSRCRSVACTTAPSSTRWSRARASSPCPSCSLDWKPDRSLEGVLGVVFRRGDEIVKNPPRPLIEDLDALPFPARELMARSMVLPPHRRHLPAHAGHGAHDRARLRRNCLFCFQIDRERRAGVRGLRLRSVENVLAEIELCLALGYREIKFLDDTFAADYDRALQLARRSRRGGSTFTWFASACVNLVDGPLLQAMKDAGCWAILMGGESGVQDNLNTLRKAETLEQIACGGMRGQGRGPDGQHAVSVRASRRDLRGRPEDHRVRARARPRSRELPLPDAVPGHRAPRATAKNMARSPITCATTPTRARRSCRTR